jgi:hypothetical protein
VSLCHHHKGQGKNHITRIVVVIDSGLRYA